MNIVELNTVYVPVIQVCETNNTNHMCDGSMLVWEKKKLSKEKAGRITILVADPRLRLEQFPKARDWAVREMN